jgi:hypothetical protein
MAGLGFGWLSDSCEMGDGVDFCLDIDAADVGLGSSWIMASLFVVSSNEVYI